MEDASVAPKMSKRILATDDPCIVQVRVDTHKKTDTVLQHIVSFIGLFCKRDL